MKPFIRNSFLTLFFICFIPSYSFAITFSRIALRVEYSTSSCPTDAPPASTTPSALGMTQCLDGSASLKAFSNCIAIYDVTCPTTIEIVDDVAYAMKTVTGVTMGEEAYAAAVAMNNFINNVKSQTCPSGYQNEGYAAGYVYESNLDASTGLVDVNVDMWKRTICNSGSTSATLVPIGNLVGGAPGGGGGGTGTSIDYAQMTSSVKSGLDASTSMADTLLALEGIRRAVVASEDRKTTVNLTGTVGLSYGDTVGAVGAGVTNAFQGSGGSLSVAPSGTPVEKKAYTKEGIASYSDTINFSKRLTSFFTTVTKSPMFKQFGLEPLGNTGGGSSSMNMDFGRYGNIPFNLDNYSGVFGAIKGIILLLGSYLAVRIVVMKR